MKKLPYKILTLATLTTIITTSGIIPSQTFAKEQVVQQAATQESKYELGPEGLKDALAQTGSYMLVMNLYAKTINAQPNIDLSGVELDTEGKGLLTTIHTNQKTARSNATFWLEKAKPQIQGTVSAISQYDTEFQNYYKTLVAAAEKRDQVVLREGLGDLLTSLETNETKIDGIVAELQNFKEKLYTDTQHFKENKSQVNSMLVANKAIGPEMEKELKQLRDTKDEHRKHALQWGIGGGIGTVALLAGAVGIPVIMVMTGGVATPIIVGVATTLGAGAIALGITSTIEVVKHLEAERKVGQSIIELSEKQNKATNAVLALDTAHESLTELSATIDLAITALTEIKGQWNKMAANYSVLLDHVEGMSYQNMLLIKDSLSVAQKEWKDIHQNAELIAKDLSNVEVETKDSPEDKK